MGLSTAAKTLGPALQTSRKEIVRKTKEKVERIIELNSIMPKHKRRRRKILADQKIITIVGLPNLELMHLVKSALRFYFKKNPPLANDGVSYDTKNCRSK